MRYRVFKRYKLNKWLLKLSWFPCLRSKIVVRPAIFLEQFLKNKFRKVVDFGKNVTMPGTIQSRGKTEGESRQGVNCKTNCAIPWGFLSVEDCAAGVGDWRRVANSRTTGQPASQARCPAERLFTTRLRWDMAGQAEAAFARSHFLSGLGRILGVPPAMRISLTSRADLP